MTGVKASALILGGRRAGEVNPLAEAHGVSDKCLVPIGGMTLIDHVAGTVAATPGIGQIVASVNDPAILDDLPVCGPLLRDGRMVAVASSGNLADSVVQAARGVQHPIMITTADHVLLTPEGITHFVDSALARKADAAAAFARREDILAVHPEGQRRFYEFRDGGYSNCNCYWLGSEAALRATETFREGGQFAKNPRRLATAFGWINLIRFRLGWDSLEASFARVSRRMRLTMVPVVMRDGSLAIDVDNERTYRVVDAVMQQRADALAREAMQAGH